jgi:glycosyltransferase involved in cell wall biosynthesis
LHSKTTIIYVGNKLAKHGINPTSIDILGVQLEELYNVVFASTYKNQIMRFLDILYTVINNSRSAKLVIIDTYSTSAFYFALATAQISKLIKIPYIPILRGGNLECRLKKSPYLSNLIFAHAYRLVAPSNFMLTLFQRYGFYNISLIPNNIVIDKYTFKYRELISPRILWVRSFANIYNPQLAIKAIVELKNEFPDIELCFVGPEKDGTMESCKKLVLKLNLEENVSFKGKLEKQ